MGVARTGRCMQGRGRPTAVGGDTPVTGRVGVAPTDDDLPGREQREAVAAGGSGGLSDRPHRRDGRVPTEPIRPLHLRTRADHALALHPAGLGRVTSPAGSTAAAGARPGSRWPTSPTPSATSAARATST